MPITPEQQRQRTQQQRHQVEHQHMLCVMEVRVKGPHTGLYCAQHSTWIKWISPRDVKKIKDII